MATARSSAATGRGLFRSRRPLVLFCPSFGKLGIIELENVFPTALAVRGGGPALAQEGVAVRADEMQSVIDDGRDYYEEAQYLTPIEPGVLHRIIGTDYREDETRQGYKA